MMTENMNQCQCTGPASQIGIRVTAPPVKKTNLYEQFHAVAKLLTVTFQAFNFLEFLVHALSKTNHHS